MHSYSSSSFNSINYIPNSIPLPILPNNNNNNIISPPVSSSLVSSIIDRIDYKTNASSSSSSLNIKNILGAMVRKEYPSFKKCYNVIWNNYGNKLVITSENSIRIFTYNNNVCVNTIDLSNKSNSIITALKFDNNDKLYTITSDKYCKIWDISSNKLVFEFEIRSGKHTEISLSNDGLLLATVNDRDIVSIYDHSNGRLVCQKDFSSLGEIRSIIFVPNSNNRLFIGLGSNLVVANIDNLEILGSFGAHASPIYTITSNGKIKDQIITSGADGYLSLWDIKNMVCLKSFGSTDFVHKCVSWAHPSIVAGCGDETGVFIYDKESGEHVCTINTKEPIHSVAYNPVHNIIAFAGDVDSSMKPIITVYSTATKH